MVRANNISRHFAIPLYRCIVSTRMLEDKLPANMPDWLEIDDYCVKLVPGFDMWNHDGDANCDWENEFYYEKSDNRVYVTALKAIKVGEPLFIYYG